MPLAEHCATPYRTSSNLNPVPMHRGPTTYQKVEPMLRTHVPEPCLRCGKSHIENPKGPLHSPHDDGGCYDRPHRHPLAVRSASQPSRNRDQLIGSLAFRCRRLCCAWSRCLATFLKRYLTPKTLLHPRIIISVTQSLLPPSLRHRWAHSLNVTA
jgi:hypothetical protein